MKTVSQRDLDKLKGKGWKLTPESKKAIHEQNVASTLSKQVEAITNLVESVDGIKDALRTRTEKDYTETINKLTKSLDSIEAKIPVIEPWEEIDFIVERDGAGTISKVRAKKI